MNLQNQPNTEVNAQEQQQAAKLSVSRRKFLVRASVGAVPVIASMQSGSAWGCIMLNCTPGEASLSNTASKVQSVAARTSSYIVPKWTSVADIKTILTTDFDGYLQNTFKTTLYNYNSTTKKYIQIAKTRQPLSTWKTCVAKTCYTKTSSTSYSLYTTTRIMPAAYNDILIDSTTLMNQFFPDMGAVTVSQALNSSDNFVKYVTSAFIGAVWESNEEYTKRFSTKCYPEASEIIRTYNLVKDRTVNGVRVGLTDMGNLFKLYTK